LLNQSSVLLKFSAINPQLRVAANRSKQFKTNTRKKSSKNENKLQKKKYEYQSNFRVDVVSFIGILTKDEPGIGLIMVGL
jgi:hypothetical protein